MSFIGGILGTIVSVGVFLISPWGPKSIKEDTSSIMLHSLSLLDVLMPIIPLGVFFGRFGNFLNQELYGTIVPQDLR